MDNFEPIVAGLRKQVGDASEMLQTAIQCAQATQAGLFGKRIRERVEGVDPEVIAKAGNDALKNVYEAIELAQKHLSDVLSMLDQAERNHSTKSTR